MFFNSALEQFSMNSNIGLMDLVVNAYFLISIWLFSTEGTSCSVYIIRVLLFDFFYNKVWRLFMKDRFDRYCGFLMEGFCLLLLLNFIGTFTYGVSNTGSCVLTTFLAIDFITPNIFNAIIRFNVNFFSLVVPIGTPGFLAKSLTMIETISYLGRFISLNVRLFINIVSGHLILKLLYSSLFTIFFFFNGFTISFILIFFFAFLLCFSIFILEIFVAVLQAYIFFFLVSIYTKECLW